jgi:arylsulfatase A-like enzyme
LLLPALLAACRAAPVRPRNLVVVCIDTLRAERLHLLGASRPTSPALDRLAARGLLLDQVQSTSDWTVPAVASLLSGRLPARHGAVIPGPMKHLGSAQESPDGIAAGVPLLAERLAAAGFRTALVSGNPYLYGRFQDGFQHVRVARADGDEQLPDLLAWLAEPSERPLFLYWQIMDLHQPLDPPATAAARFAPEPAPADYPAAYADWSWGRVDAATESDPAFLAFRRAKLDLYDGTLRHVDDLVARLLAELDRLGLAGSTLVVVTADHGEEFWDHAVAESADARDPRGMWGVGHGHTMYQELLRVPVILAGPGVPEGRVDHCPASLADVVPTVLARLGRPAMPDLDGIDLGPRIDAGGDPASRPCPRRPLMSEAPAYGPDSAALRVGSWKLVWRDGEAPTLYDLDADPGEQRSLAAARPEVVARLAPVLDRLRRTEVRSAPMPLDDELRAQLRALGYLQ